MPASSQRRRHGEGATITCHPRRRARPALPREGEELHVRPVPRWAARGLVPARCGAGGAQGRGGTGRHLRKRAAPNVQYSRFEAPITLQSRSPFFFDLFASRGFIEGAYCVYQGMQRPPRHPHDRWLAIDAPRLGTRPVHPTRAPPTPSTRHLLPQSQKSRTRSHNNDNITRPAKIVPATPAHAATNNSSRSLKHSARAFSRALPSNPAKSGVQKTFLDVEADKNCDRPILQYSQFTWPYSRRTWEA